MTFSSPRRLWCAPLHLARLLAHDLRLPAPAPHTPRRVILVAVLIGLAAALFNQLGVPLRASYAARVNVDEPFYLLTTVSLLEDGDLDLLNDYALQRYRVWWDHPQELWHQSVPTDDRRILSPHNAGLSVLVLPAYALAGVDGVKAFLGALGGITASLMLLLAWRATGNLAASALASALLAGSAPLFVYGTQIYPEGPAALLVTACTLLLVGNRPGVRAALLLALGLNGLVWLGSKYAIAGSVIGMLTLLRLPPRARVAFAGGLAPCAALYVWFHLATYGALTPYTVNVVYAGTDTAQLVGQHFELWDRLYRFAGLWIDGEFGVARWTPAVLLVLPAVPLLVRQTGPVRWAIPAIVGAQLLVAVFLSITMRGWWFPGRMLIAALPLLAVPLAVFFAAARGRAVLTGLATLLAVSTLATTLSLRAAAANGEVVLAVDPFAMAWPPFRAAAALFPVYTSYTPVTWLLTAAWLLGAGVAVGYGVRLARKTNGKAAPEARPQRIAPEQGIP